MLVLVGLVNIWLVRCGWFWSFLFELVWLIVGLLSIVWAETVDEPKSVAEMQAQDTQTPR